MISIRLLSFVFAYHTTILEIKRRNPNPSPTGIKFGFLKYGGLYWTRTSDPIDVNDVLYQLSQQTKSLGTKDSIA